jgi:hypothetical protein
MVIKYKTSVIFGVPLDVLYFVKILSGSKNMLIRSLIFSCRE